MARAYKFTIEDKKIEYFSDFLTNFDLNPISGQLATVTNEEAVSNAMKALVLTNLTERFYHPNIGSKIQSGLFEIDDIAQTDIIKTSIETTLRNYEPRCNLERVEVIPEPDNNAVKVQIYFTLINSSTIYTTTLYITRVR